jgi:hypothetical protein
LASGLTRAIDIEHLPLPTCSIEPFASLPLFGEGASEQMIEEACAQSFDGCLSPRRQNA